MTPIFHQNFEMVVLEKCQGINPVGLSATLDDYKNQQLFRIPKLKPKPWDIPPKKVQVINPMGICAPWYESYLHNWINPQNIDHQKFISLISSTVMFALKQSKTLSKWTVSNDVYKSMYLEYPSYSTFKNNSIKKQQE